MNTYTKELDIAIQIAKDAGVIMLKYFDADQEVEKKEDNTFVTIADKLINTMVIERLKEAFPLDGVIGEEESNTEYGMGRKWFCDPIDGTAGYIWGTPTSMFSLALVVDGVPTVGVALDPFLNKMYTGIKGGKSFYHNNQIQVSKKDLLNGIVAVGSIKYLSQQKFFPRFNEDKVRMATFSGAVYKAGLVSRGRFVAYIDRGLNAHDIAAMHVILENAGGKITAVDGSTLDYSKPFKGAIISNNVVHDKLVEYCK
jgi:fructose-1,6-bisphosphatase/inositol monophosphatase family enzyme